MRESHLHASHQLPVAVTVAVAVGPCPIRRSAISDESSAAPLALPSRQGGCFRASEYWRHVAGQDYTVGRSTRVAGRTQVQPLTAGELERGAAALLSNKTHHDGAPCALAQCATDS